MINYNSLHTNFSELTKKLLPRGVKKEQLATIRDKLQKEKELLTIINQQRAERNQLSTGLQNAEKVKLLKEKLKKVEEELESLQEEIKKLISYIPNIPAINVPPITEGNRLIKTIDYEYNIEHSLTYEEIARKLAIVDEEKGIRLSGNKFIIYQGLGCQLIHALVNFMLHQHQKENYQLFTLPYLVREQNLYNTGQLPKLKEDMFKLENSNLYLIPTAEVPLVNLYYNQIIEENKLPLKVCSYSPCFRAEAGAAGQENKGFIRLHQFHKVEMVRLVQPENSYHQLEEMVKEAQNILHLLKIPHRVIELSVAELGFSATKTYDIEVWLPVSKKWLEISSCSNCEDFQARRAKIRVKDKLGKKYLPHTLNASGLAIDRLIAILLEYYYQEKDNSLAIPKVLKNYFWD